MSAGDDRLTLQEAADRLGVHYMTVYRHVRTGRLAARKVDGRWQVIAADLRPADPPATTGRRGAPDRHRQLRRVEDRLIAGDEPGVWRVLEEAMAAGTSPGAVHLELLLPALASIGRRWAAGEATVGEEHFATAVAQRVIGRLGPRFARPGRRRGTVVVGSAPGDQHALVGAVLADLLRGASFEAVDLGASPLPSSFAERPAAGSVLAVVVSATNPGGGGPVGEVVEAVRRVSAVPIVVGGAGVAADDVAAYPGVHHLNDPTRLVAFVEALRAATTG